MLINREKEDVLRVIKNSEDFDSCFDAQDVKEKARARVLDWVEAEGDLWAEAVFDWYEWSGNVPPPEKKHDVCEYIRRADLTDWAEGEWEAYRESLAEYYDSLNIGGMHI